MSAPVGCRDIHGRMLARELGDGKEDRAVPRREPRPGHGFGRRLSGVPKSLGGPWVGGVGGMPEGYINVTPFIDALQANDPFNRSPTVALPCCAPRALHRRTSDIRPSSRTVRVGAARPNSAPSKKRILCDRHHTASAMAELSLLFVDRTAYAVVRVPPKHSAPLTRGLFLVCRVLNDSLEVKVLYPA